MTPESRAEFEALARPLIKFLNDHGHPHMRIIIDNQSAEVVEGVAAFTTREYWRD